MKWEETTLGELIYVKHGFPFKSKHFASKGSHILLTPGNCLNSGGLKFKGEKEKFYNGEIPSEFVLDTDDFLIVMTDLVNSAPVLGGAFKIPQDDRFLHNQRLGLVTIKDTRTTCKDFIYWVCNSQNYRGQIRGSASGATVRHTSPSRIYDVKIPLPPLPTQKRIASILSAYDDLIEVNRRRIQLLEESARLLYREWFVHLRFPNHQNTKITNGVPERWKMSPLSDIADCNSQNFKAKELPDMIRYIDISCVRSGEISLEQPIPREEAPGRARRRLNDGDILWSNVRPNLKGYGLILSPEENDVASTGFTVLSAKNENFSFVYCSVTTSDFIQHLVNHATGAGYPAVRPPDFERAEILTPPPKIIKAFQQATEPSFRQTELLTRQNHHLTRARDLLLPRLMSGELVV